MVRHGSAYRIQIFIIDRIDNGITSTLGNEAIESRGNGLRALVDDRMCNKTYRFERLLLQHPNQIGIGHWRQWMITHAGFAQQHIADEQMTVKNRPFVLRECRTRHSERDVQCFSKCIGDRADVSARGRVKRRAIFEKKLLAACRTQPFQRFERLSNGFFRADGTAFQGNDDSIDIIRQGPLRHTDHL
ncbi:hypothetical protein D3C85_1094200 [compost metagenome]